MQKSFDHTDTIYSDSSAEEIVPLLMEIFKPFSVIDIGCGIGNFLKLFKGHNLSDITGLDGSWVELEKLSANIPVENFVPIDLEKDLNIFADKVNRKFDLLISLEVAEHISEKNAVNFIASICRLSDTVVFSAAIPFQGGQDHINEQWPSYWIRLFNKNGFVGSDSLKTKIWNNPKIHWWYRQNILHFVRHPSKQHIEWDDNNISAPPNIVHPDNYLLKSEWINNLMEGKITFGYAWFLVKNILKKKIK